MQSVKFKDGTEIVSMELDKEKAKQDIVQRFVKMCLEKNEGLIREVNVNMPAVGGAIMVIRLVNEMVNEEGCSKEFRELVGGQRELMGKIMGVVEVMEEERNEKVIVVP